MVALSTDLWTLLDLEIQHRTGTRIHCANLSQEVPEPFAAQLPQQGAVGNGAGAH